MKTLTQKGQRIIDNIFDLMLETPFLDQAKKELYEISRINYNNQT